MPSTPTSFAAIKPLLTRLGLDEKEIEVYLTILPLKVARVTDVAKAARQSRSHTYLILRSLKEKGLVSEVERGKVIHFIAEPPERLLSYVQDQEQEYRDLHPLVEGVLPVLKNMTAPLVGKPRVTMLSGMKGMKQLYRDVFQHEYVAFFNPQAMFDAFDCVVTQTIFGKDYELHGRDLLVDNDGSKKYLDEIIYGNSNFIRILPKGMSFGTDTIVFGDTVALFAYDAEKTIVRIENQNIADSFRSWFEVVWEVSKDA